MEIVLLINSFVFVFRICLLYFKQSLVKFQLLFIFMSISCSKWLRFRAEKSFTYHIFDTSWVYGMCMWIWTDFTLKLMCLAADAKARITCAYCLVSWSKIDFIYYLYRSNSQSIFTQWHYKTINESAIETFIPHEAYRIVTNASTQFVEYGCFWEKKFSTNCTTNGKKEDETSNKYPCGPCDSSTNVLWFYIICVYFEYCFVIFYC